MPLRSLFSGVNFTGAPVDNAPPNTVSLVASNAGVTELIPLPALIGIISATLTPLTAASGPTGLDIMQRTSRTGGTFSKGQRAVSLSITASGATAMQYRLYDANSSGATSAPGTGTALTGWTTPGVNLAAGINAAVSLTLPASNYDYYLDLAPAGSSFAPIRMAAKFAIGERMAVAGQSLAVDFVSPTNNDTTTTLASLGLTPNGSTRVTTGHDSTPVSSVFTAPGDGTAYDGSGVVEFGNRMSNLLGVRIGVVGFTYSGVSITTYQPGQGNYLTLLASINAAGGGIGTLFFLQGHGDAGTTTPGTAMATATYLGYLQTFIAALTAAVGSFNTVLCSIPSAVGYNYLPIGVDQIRSAHLQYAAANPTTCGYVSGLDATQSGFVHPTEAGQQILARHVYRAAAALLGQLSHNDKGPVVTTGARLTTSGTIKLSVSQNGGTALTTAGTAAGLAAQFAVYPAGTTSSPYTVSTASVASATEIDLVLSTTPADTVAVDVWYRPFPDTAAGIAAGFYDNVTDTSDPDLGGRQLYLYSGALAVAAPSAATTPLAPTVTGTSGFTTQLTLTITPNASAGTPATYAVQQSTSSTFSSGITTPTGGASLAGGTSPATLVVTGLTASTTYYFRATATNSYGTSAQSSIVSVTTAAATTPPGQVQSLAAGAAVGTSIPVTYTAPVTGAAVVSYSGATSTDNVTFTANAGTFNATGGTFTGLASATAYYLQVIATNAGGSSTTQVAGTVTTGTVIGPAMTMTSPTYDTTGQKLGSGALSGGKGVATLTRAGTGTCSFGFFFKSSNNTTTFPILSDGSNGIGITNGNLYAYGPGGHNIGSTNVCDGAWHWIAGVSQSDGNTSYHIDGGGQSTYYTNVGITANPTFTVTATGGTQAFSTFGTVAGAGEIDCLTILNGIQSSIVAVPTTEPTSATANLLAGYGFNGNGLSV